MTDELDRLHDLVPAAAIEEISGWRDDPELGKLHASLAAIRDQEQLQNAYAEAIVARHLLELGCELRVEVETPQGKSADFEVSRDDHTFYLHVKRINIERQEHKRPKVSSRLRYLERIKRPYIVRIRWRENLDDSQMQRLVTSAAEFIRHARVGDELIVHDDDDEQSMELGGCRIIAPWDGDHVNLTIGPPSGFIDAAPRMLKLLRRAHRQFMPKETNVILLSSSHMEDIRDYESALLGSHIERWDEHPPKGRRIAHGRAADGFWHDQTNHDSAVAGWFRFTLTEEPLLTKMWFREEADIPRDIRELFVSLFLTE